MTMLVWAACENYALLMADTRETWAPADQPPVDGTPGLLRVDGKTKFYFTEDHAEAFGIAGNENVVKETLLPFISLRGLIADEAIFEAVGRNGHLTLSASAAHPQLSNTLMHAYRHEGKNVCSAIEWSASGRSLKVFSSNAPQFGFVSVGSSPAIVQYIMAASPETGRWQEAQKSTDDPGPVKAYLARIFGAVSRLDQGVSESTAAYVLRSGSDAWTTF